MKFTHQLKFNSVPEWREHYIQYGHLKKYIYALAKKEADLQAGGQDEEALLAPLLEAERDQVTEQCISVVLVARCELCGALRGCKTGGLSREVSDTMRNALSHP